MYHLLRRLAVAFALAGSSVAMLTGIMTVTSVAGRALFTEPIQGDVELTQFGIALAISLALPWCQLKGGNIIVDFFTQKSAPRTQNALDAIGALLLAVMCGLLAWRTAVGAISVKEAGEQSMILSLPMWWCYVSLAPGLALAGLVALAQSWLHLSGRSLDELTSAAGAEGSAA